MNAARIALRSLCCALVGPIAPRAWLAAAGVAALALGACGYDWPADNDRGGPGVVTTTRPDGATDGASDSGRLDASADRPADVSSDRPADALADRGADSPGGGGQGTGGAGSPPGSGGGGGGAGGNAPSSIDTGGGTTDGGGTPEPTPIDKAKCDACMMENCAEELVELGCQKTCFEDTTPMDEGPAQGKPRKDLCASVLSCYDEKKCVRKAGEEYTPNACLCGDTAAAQCAMPGGAAGACVQQIQYAAGSVDPVRVTANWNKPTSVLGCANLITLCRYNYCPKECLGLGADPPTTPPPATPPPATPPPATPPPATPPPATPPPATPPPATPPPATPPPATPPPATPPPATPPPATPPPTTPPPATPPPATPPPATPPPAQSSLLVNGDFATTVDPWLADSDVTLRWEKVDGKDNPASGAAVVTNTSSTMAARAARQCVRVGAEKTYGVLGQLFIKPGQGALRAAGIKVRYFDGEACAPGQAGGSLGEVAFLEQGMGAWKSIDNLIITPPRTRSALVQLVADTEGGAPFEVKFDNIALEER